MNVTFIIGNGFDLNLNLKTSYSQFVDYYINNIKSLREYENNEQKKLLEDFSEIIQRNEERWSEAELEFGRVTKEFAKMSGDCGMKFSDCYQDFLRELGVYLENEEKKITGIVKEPAFLKAFGMGIQDYMKGLKTTDREYILDKTKSITGGINFSIINFNYTRIVDIIHEECKNQHASVLGIRHYRGYRDNNYWVNNIHVHGKLDGYLVFGVDNEGQISNKSIFDKNINPMRVLIKNENDKMIGEKYDATGLKFLNASDIIYLYGVSMGETDKTWWKRIIQLLKEAPNTYLIIYSNTLNKMPQRRTPLEREAKKEEISDRFMKYSDFDSQTNDIIKKRIFIDGNNIFEDLGEMARNSMEND